ncbi:MAG: sugar transferase [Clostridia bacterium]|nr:sugar transferase [Clostridia bacterium]
MKEFLSEWYGVLAFVLFDIAAFIAVVAITYRWFFKRVIDFFAALICLIVTSPFFLVIVLRGKSFKKRAGVGLSLLQKTPFVGKKGKTAYRRTFRYEDEDGDTLGSYGKFLKKTGFYKLPALVDILCGRLAFIGVKPISEVDAEFLDEEDEARFVCRAGLINPLVVSGDQDTDYAEMLASDKRYALRGGLGADLRIFFTWLLKLIRNGKTDEYFGKTRERSYAETLLEAGEITKEDYEAVTGAYAD